MTINEKSIQSSAYFISKDQLTEYGSLTAWLYRNYVNNEQQLRVMFRNDAGATASFPLSGLTVGMVRDSADILLTANDLWVMIGKGPLTLYRYRYFGTPMPVSVTLFDTLPLPGDQYCIRGGGMIELASGAVAATWYRNDQNVRTPEQVDFMRYGIAYVPASGSPTIIYPLSIPKAPGASGFTYSRMAQAQHPVDGSVWIFAKQDADHHLSAMRFVEANNALGPDWYAAPFISSGQHGTTDEAMNGPDGEFPWLVARQNGSVIDLAYQSWERYQWVITSGGAGTYIGAKLIIAKVAADKSVTFTPRNQDWTERTSPFVFADGFVVYPRVEGEPLSKDKIYASDWTNQVFVFKTATSLCSGINKPQFAAQRYINSIPAVVLYGIEKNDVPVPPLVTPPTVELSADKATAKPGETVTFTIRFGGASETIRNAVVTCNLLGATQMKTIGTVLAGAFSLLTVTAVMGATTAAGTIMENTAMVSFDGGVASSNTVRFAVEQVAGVTLSSATGYTLKPGKIVQISVKLTNSGNGPDTYALTATDTNLWPLKLAASSLALSAGQQVQAWLSVTVPKTSNNQTNTITVLAISAFDTQKQSEVSIVVKVKKK